VFLGNSSQVIIFHEFWLSFEHLWLLLYITWTHLKRSKEYSFLADWGSFSVSFLSMKFWRHRSKFPFQNLFLFLSGRMGVWIQDFKLARQVLCFLSTTLALGIFFLISLCHSSYKQHCQVQLNSHYLEKSPWFSVRNINSSKPLCWLMKYCCFIGLECSPEPFGILRISWRKISIC
jgi:hypothetical protein